MAAPKPKPALTKAPRKSHPAAPPTPAAGPDPAPSARSGTDAVVQVNVRVPKAVRTEIKRAALDADETVNEWLLDAIERKLAG